MKTADIKSVIELTSVYIVNGTVSVPKSDDNASFRNVKEWIAEGNTPEQYVEPEPTYAELRQAEYPPIGEQLDMLYHAIDSGVFGEDAKNINFFTSLKAVKEKYPKEGL